MLSFQIIQDRVLRPNTIDYLCSVMYNAYYCFEALTVCNIDDVACGLCGVVGKVYLGDGNAKNCCNVSAVSIASSVYLIDNLFCAEFKVGVREFCSYAILRKET